MELPAKIKPFDFHGISIAEVGDEHAKAHCFSCGKDKHLNVRVDNGTWRCVACNASGNIPSFLGQLYTLCLAATTDSQVAKLSKDRKVSTRAIRAWGVAYNHFNDTWLIPGYNLDNKLSTLYKCDRSADGWIVLSTPGCKIQPMNSINTPQKDVTITEGPWDGMAWWDVLTSIGYNLETGKYFAAKTLDTALIKEQGVMVFPGANAIPKDAPKLLAGRDVCIAFDNDHPRVTPTGNVIKPGFDGTQLLIRTLSKSRQKPNSLRYLLWGEDGYTTALADGYDLRDLASQHKPHVAYHKLRLLTRKHDPANPGEEEDDGEEEVIPIPRTSFADLCADWESKLHFPRELKQTLWIVLGALFSTTLDGEQIFLRVLGQAGTGKTVLAEAISAAKKYVYPRSILTGFHSGLGEDAGLIESVNGKMFVLKDGDTLLQASNRDHILAELRDIYDGASRAEWRNKKKSIHTNIRLSVLICGTQELRKLNRSALGERFLDCEIINNDDTNLHAHYVKSAIKRSVNIVTNSIAGEVTTDEDKMYIKQCTVGYINHIKEQLANRMVKIPKVTHQDEFVIECIGNYVAYMRARSNKDADGLDYKPRKELGTRLGGQMMKQAICCAVVGSRETIDNEIMELIRKLMEDTIHSYRADIVDLLYGNPNGATKLQLSISLKVPETTMEKILDEMLTFGILKINKQDNRSGSRGRKCHCWTLTDEFALTYKVAKNKYVSTQELDHIAQQLTELQNNPHLPNTSPNGTKPSTPNLKGPLNGTTVHPNPKPKFKRPIPLRFKG